MRRLPALIGFVAVAVVLVVTARAPVEPTSAVFAEVPIGWMPSAPPLGDTPGAATWFCPGMPSGLVDEITGEPVSSRLVVANRAGGPAVVRVSWLGPDGVEPVEESLALEGYGVLAVDPAARVGGGFVAAVVEVDGDALVEQQIVHPAATTATPCATATSSTWYFAEGFTAADSTNQLVLTNPFEEVVVVDLAFATIDGPRVPDAFRGLPIQPRSVRVVDLGDPGTGTQGEPLLAVEVIASNGELVVGRAQRFDGGGRGGFTMTLAAPELRDQWWFAEGDKGPDITEIFTVYNPTDREVTVDVIFLGIADLADVDPLVVPPGEVAFYDPGQVPVLAEGRHAIVFSTLGDPAIVVERALTRVVDGIDSTSVNMGAPPGPGGHVASQWYLAVGPDGPAPDALVIYNVDNAAGELRLEIVSPTGPVPVVAAAPIPAAGIVTLDLGGPGQYIITSTTRIFVERLLPGGIGRSASWAIPSRG